MKILYIIAIGFAFAAPLPAFSASTTDIKATESKKSANPAAVNIESSNRDHFSEDAQTAAKVKKATPSTATTKDGGSFQTKQQIK